MPRVVISNVDPALADVDAASGNYAGPTPPKGVYRTKLVKLKLAPNSNGDMMFTITSVIDEAGEKAKYNGCLVSNNCTLGAKSAMFANAMLDAYGWSRKAVWANADGGIITAKDDDERVGKIGGKLVKDAVVHVLTKNEEWPVGSGTFRVKVDSYVAGDIVAPRESAVGYDDDDGDDEGSNGTAAVEEDDEDTF